jgi:hypothetical protein
MAGASAGRRVELNRSVLDAITLATADGLFEMAKAAVFEASVPDAPPYGTGLLQGGGAVAWVRGKKVATTTIGGKQIKAPRGAGVSRMGIVAAGGYGFPGHLVEFGTVKMGAEPFLTPSLMAVAPDAVEFVRLGITKHAIIRDVVKGLKVAAAHGDQPRVKAARRAARAVGKVGPR